MSDHVPVTRPRSLRREDRRARSRPRSVPRPGAPAPGASTGGRAWINGREVGGASLRFAHLSRSYD